MLGDGKASRRADESRRGRDVDRARAVAAGPARVREEIVRPLERLVGGAERARRAGQLGRGLPLEPERDQHRGDSGLGESPVDERREQDLGFGFIQGRTGIEARQGRFHRLGEGGRGRNGRLGEIAGHVHFFENSRGERTKKPAGRRADRRGLEGPLEGRRHQRREAAAAEGLESHHQSQACWIARDDASAGTATSVSKRGANAVIPIKLGEVARRVKPESGRNSGFWAKSMKTDGPLMLKRLAEARPWRPPAPGPPRPRAPLRAGGGDSPRRRLCLPARPKPR